MKVSTKSIFLGAVLGCTLTLMAIGISKVAQGLRSLGGLVLHTDQVVRDQLKSDGIRLPDSAYSIHHARAGFQDYTTWMRFSLSPEHVETFIQEHLNLSVTDLKEGLPPEYAEEIYQNENQNYDLTWWAPNLVKNPRIWRKNDSVIETWVVDMNSGTFYIFRHDY